MADNGDDGESNIPVNKWNRQHYSKDYLEYWAKFAWPHKSKFLQGLKDHQTLILDTYCCWGKTTQIPRFVLDYVYDIRTMVDKLPIPKMMVACTLTTPMAVIGAANLVARQMDLQLGEEVCYQLASEDYMNSEKELLKFLPDNVLLLEAMTDPLLRNYKVIIVDEAHERTCVKYVLLGYLKKLVKLRPDLKLVVMSGTHMGTLKLKEYFSDALLVIVQGEPMSGTHMGTVKLKEYFSDALLMIGVHGDHHAVEFHYLEKKPDEKEGGYLEEAIKRVVKIHMDEGPGNILVFLAEVKEIEFARLEIINRVKSMVEMYGPVQVVILNNLLSSTMMSVWEFDQLATEKPERRIVLATNIAETSIALNSIVYVVDCGYVRQKIYDDQVHAESVQVSLISQERAEERSGNVAGRIRKCFRLYTKEMFDNFEPHTYPEIRHSNLARTVLTLKKLGINEHFDFMDPPDPERFKQALEVLNYLGALDDELNLTELGMSMAEFPLDPQMSKMLLSSPGFGCSHEILTISAMLSVPDCFLRPNEEFKEAADEAKTRFCHLKEGDHITLLNVYKAYQTSISKLSWCCDNFVNARVLESANYLRSQLVCLMLRMNFNIMTQDDSNDDYYVNIRKAILAGFFMQVAYLDSSGQYLTLKDNQKVTLHPSSSLDHKPKWVVYNENVLDTVGKTNSIRTVTPVCQKWLVELVPHYWKNVKKDTQEGE